MQSVEEIVAVALREWRAMGVVPADRAALAEDLRHELAAAAADGVSPAQLLDGADLRAFARRLATESGATRLPYETGRLLRTALAGAAPGLVLGWTILWQPVTSNVDVPAVLLSLYALCGLLVYGGALAAVRYRMAEVPEIGRTVLAMGLLLPVTGASITPLTMGFAWLTGYSTASVVVTFEVALVAGALAGAILLARWWALAPALGPSRLAASGAP